MSLVRTRKNNGSFPTLSEWMGDFWPTSRFFDEDVMRTNGPAMPAVNVRETDKDYEIEVAAPGMKKEDFNVQVEEGSLTISAESEREEEEKEGDYTRKEFSYASFRRTFTLPADAEEEDIVAKYNDGVLRLTVHKTKAVTPPSKKVEVS